MDFPDLSTLTTELPDNRCGDNCEYDQSYMELDSLAVGVPDSEMGESVSEGKDPDFPKLCSTCLSLWEKTRDLRVATYYTIGLSCCNGLEGLKFGLQIIDYLIDNMWDVFYPQLDPDDDNDPTERVNILHMLSPQSGSYNDPIRFIFHLRQNRFVDSLPYSIRDVMVVQGFIEGKADNEVDPVIVNAELNGVPAEEMEKRGQCVDDILALLDKISSSMNEKMGNAGYLNLEALIAEMKSVKKFISSYKKGGVSSDESSNVQETGVTEQKTDLGNGGSESGKKYIGFDIKSFVVSDRGDALMLIKKCSDFFAKTEPTSPLPFLLNRALRMSDMNLLDIMREIDENSVSKAMEQLGVIQKAEE